MVSNKESAVIFVDIEEVYSFNEDLICKFVPNHYTPQDGDRVAMFKLGWKSVKDYILFEWAPVGLPESIEHEVVFERHDLPQNILEIYQICYISSENILHGATIPFQFQFEAPKRRKSISDILSSSYSPMLQLDSCKDILKLRRTKRENNKNLEKDKMAQIPERLSQSFSEKQTSEVHKDCEKEIAELKFQIDSLRRTIAVQQNEINALKMREKRFEKNSGKESKIIFDYDLGELEPIPPFPLNL